MRNTVDSCIQIMLFICRRGGGNWGAKIPTSDSQNLGIAMANFQVCCFSCRGPKLYQLSLVLTLTEAVKVWSWFCLVFVFLFCVSFRLLAVEVPTLRITLLMHGTWVFHEASSLGGVLKSNSVIMPRVTIHSPEHAVLATHLFRGPTVRLRKHQPP